MRSLLLVVTLFLGSACSSQQQATIQVPTLMVLPSETPPLSIIPPTDTQPATLMPTSTPAFEVELAMTPSAPTVAPTEVAGVITATGTVRLRTNAGFEFETIAEVEPGVSVMVIGRDETGQWVNVRLDDGQEGWVILAVVSF